VYSLRGKDRNLFGLRRAADGVWALFYQVNTHQGPMLYVLNIFVQQICENIGVFLLKILLVCAKIGSQHWFLRETPNIKNDLNIDPWPIQAISAFTVYYFYFLLHWKTAAVLFCSSG
jgi:hypothetical protein